MSEENKTAASGKRRLQSPIGLREGVGLLSVVIAGLGLYVSYLQNRDHQQERQDEQQRARAQSALILRGEGDGGRIKLEPANGGQVVQSQAFYFPGDVRSGAVQITGQGHIEAGWFADGLKKALHGTADGGGERSLPVAITTSYVEDGEVRTDTALYQVGFTVHPRMLQSAEVRIEGLALSRRGLTGNPQAAADSAWARQAPAKP